MPYVAAYICSAVTMLILDIGWLTFATPRLYKPIIGEIMAPKPSLAPAIAFYLIYVAGLIFLAVGPQLKTGSIGRAALSAAVFGFVAYATYDLTNQATLKVWSLKLSLADMAWGALVTAIAGAAGFWGARAVARLTGAG